MKEDGFKLYLGEMLNDEVHGRHIRIDRDDGYFEIRNFRKDCNDVSNYITINNGGDISIVEWYYNANGYYKKRWTEYCPNGTSDSNGDYDFESQSAPLSIADFKTFQNDIDDDSEKAYKF